MSSDLNIQTAALVFRQSLQTQTHIEKGTTGTEQDEAVRFAVVFLFGTKGHSAE
jgi:hypothetical protein